MQKQWEQIFLSLYKNTKQKEAFDIYINSHTLRNPPQPV